MGCMCCAVLSRWSLDIVSTLAIDRLPVMTLGSERFADAVSAEHQDLLCASYLPCSFCISSDSSPVSPVS